MPAWHLCVIRDGLLKVNSASTLKGNNVLLFFTGENALMEMDSKSSLALTGRTEGPYVDLVISRIKTQPRIISALMPIRIPQSEE